MIKPTCAKCGGKDCQFLRQDGVQTPLCLKCLETWYALRDKVVKQEWPRFLLLKGRG